MGKLKEALFVLETQLSYGSMLIECAGTVNEKITGAYFDLDEHGREYFGHEYAERAQAITQHYIEETLKALKKADAGLQEVYAALRIAANEEKETEA